MSNCIISTISALHCSAQLFSTLLAQLSSAGSAGSTLLCSTLLSSVGSAQLYCLCYAKLISAGSALLNLALLNHEEEELIENVSYHSPLTRSQSQSVYHWSQTSPQPTRSQCHSRYNSYHWSQTSTLLTRS